MELSQAEQVLIRGKCFLYKQKAPFVPSGKSVLGALEYDEATDKVRCHECGGWFKHVGSHLSPAHSMTSREYKRKHGLRSGAALCGYRVSSVMSSKHTLNENFVQRSHDPEVRLKAASASARSNRESKERRLKSGEGTSLLLAENRNINGKCHAQILERLTVLRERIGRTPSRSDIRDDGMSYKSILAAFNVSTLGAVMSLLRFAKTSPGRQTPKYPKELLVEMLRDFYVRNHRLPCGKDYGRTLPGQVNFHKQFGSMRSAIKEAGLEEFASKRSRNFGTYTKDSLVEYLRGFYRKHGRLPTKIADKDSLPSHPVFLRLFGSMRAAWDAAGLLEVANAERVAHLDGDYQCLKCA